jgi:hypothetical protein
LNFKKESFHLDNFAGRLRWTFVCQRRWRKRSILRATSEKVIKKWSNLTKIPLDIFKKDGYFTVFRALLHGKKDALNQANREFTPKSQVDRLKN